MRDKLRQYIRSRGGNVIMTFSLAFPVLLGAAGLAVDSASFYDQQARMQSVADASALAVAKELFLYRKNLGELKAAGTSRAEALLVEAGIGNRTHWTDVIIDAPQNRVVVEVKMVAKSLLPANVWGENPIRVTSEAKAYGQNRLCVLGLDGSSSNTIKASASARLTASECAVQSNSKDPGGLNVATGSQLVSTVICTSGGAMGGGSYTPAPETDCPQLDDPLAARQMPPGATAGCYDTNRIINGGKLTISPGVYCGGLTIGKNAVVTAAPGIYFMTLGSLRVSDTATLTGENVSFVFVDDVSTLTFAANTTVSLTAPKDGPMAGILFYESRLAPLGRNFTIFSNNAHQLLGTIYLPRGRLLIDTKAKVADLSAYTVIVAKQIDVKSANLVVNADYGGTDVPVPEGVGPNSRYVRLSD